MSPYHSIYLSIVHLLLLVFLSYELSLIGICNHNKLYYPPFNEIELLLLTPILTHISILKSQLESFLKYLELHHGESAKLSNYFQTLVESNYQKGFFRPPPITSPMEDTRTHILFHQVSLLFRLIRSLITWKH